MITSSETIGPTLPRFQVYPNAINSCPEPFGSGALDVNMGKVMMEVWRGIEQADVVLAMGIGTAANPLIGSKLLSAQNRGAKLIVVESGISPVSRAADLHLQIRPGTNLALANAMLCILIEQGYLDEGYIHQRTTGFGETVIEALNMCPSRAADICGVDRKEIRMAATWYGEAQRAMILHSWCADRPLEALYALSYLNLVHATGRAGKPGYGYAALTGRGGCPSGDLSCRVSGEGLTDMDGKARFHVLRYQQPAAEAPGGDATVLCK